MAGGPGVRGGIRLPAISGTRHYGKRAINPTANGSGTSNLILVERPQQFLVAPLDPVVAIAGDRLEALQVQNGNAASADLNKPGILQSSFNQVDGGPLHAKHLSEEFLGEPDVVAAQTLPALQQPSGSAVFHLMQCLTSRRLLRLRQQRQVEQGDGLAKAFARLADAMDVGCRNAGGLAADLNDRFSKRRHDSMDRGRADHTFPAYNG